MREGCWGGMEDIGNVMVGLLAGCYDKRVGLGLSLGGGGGVVGGEGGGGYWGNGFSFIIFGDYGIYNIG